MEVGPSSDDGEFVAFMEQASLAYSMKALDRIGARHGLTVAENEEGASLRGDLAIGKYAVLHVDACSLEELPGFDCYAYLEPDAYDAAKAALTRSYGEPVAMWDVPTGFVWHFAEVDISLRQSDADTIEVLYALQPFGNDFYPSFPPLLATAVAPDLARAPQATTHTDAGALEFLEQALQAESWDALGEMGQRYGVTMEKERDYQYKLSGNFSVAGFTAAKGKAYRFDPPGFDCSAEFDSEAYDAVLEALVDRYGDPRIVWEHSPSLVWDFSAARVYLYHSSFDGGVDLHYSSSESPDASLPTFPPPQASASTPVPTQAPIEEK